MNYIVIFLLLLVQALGDDDLPVLEPRIFEGTDADIKDFPYFAGLGNCGATILTNEWLLTAAHCVSMNPLIEFFQYFMPLRTVYVGGESENNSLNLSYNKVIVHPDADLALLKLSKPLKFTNKIQPVKLPKIQYPEGNYIAIGRGILKPDQSSTAKHLQKLPVIRLSTEKCLLPYSVIQDSYYYLGIEELDTLHDIIKIVTNKVICIERRDKLAHNTNQLSACSGDSGSPLVVNGVLVGVASSILNYVGQYGAACGELSYYTNVLPYVPWIQEIIATH